MSTKRELRATIRRLRARIARLLGRGAVREPQGEGTLNIGPTGKLADLLMMASKCVVFGCQEGSDQHQITGEFADQNPDWKVFHSSRPGEDAVPTFVRRDLGTRLRMQYHLAVERRWVGLKGAGKSEYAHRKFIAHLTIDEDRHFLTTHFTPSWTRTKRYLGRKEWEARREHVQDHVAAIVRLVRALDGDVTLVGDFNGEADRDLLQPLRDLGFVGWTDEPTKGGGAIDHVLHLRRNRCKVVSIEVVPNGSDHHAVVKTSLWAVA